MFKSSSSAAVKLINQFGSGSTCWLAWIARQRVPTGNFAQFADAFVNPRQRSARALQTFEREIERLAVMRGEQQITDFAAGETFRQQIAQREKVAERLAHLFAFDQQMRAVQPVFDERLAGRAFALGDFVLVMRKNQILAAEVQIEASARAPSCSWR